MGDFGSVSEVKSREPPVRASKSAPETGWAAGRCPGMPSKLPKGLTKLARDLRDDVKAISAGRPMWWVSVHELALRHAGHRPDTVKAAVALAIDKGWLHGQPGPGPTDCVSYKYPGSFGQ